MDIRLDKILASKEKDKSVMRNFFLLLCSYLIPLRRAREAFQLQHVRRLLKGDIKHNSVTLRTKSRVRVEIEGKNNIVLIEGGGKGFGVLDIRIAGDNNRVHIKKGSNAPIRILVGIIDNTSVSNCSVIWGENISSRGVSCLLLEDNTQITVGDNCLFADDIELRCTDDHAILNEMGEVINRAQAITIGDHVWMGQGVRVMKNSVVPEGCVVGMNTVVARKFTEPNCVIVGNPGRVVKQNIRWDCARPNVYPAT